MLPPAFLKENLKVRATSNVSIRQASRENVTNFLDIRDCKIECLDSLPSSKISPISIEREVFTSEAD